MADKEIPDLTSGGAAASGDAVHVVRSGNSREAILGDAAGKNVGTGAGTVAAGDDNRFDDLARRGHIWGLTLSNNSTDATNDIDIAAGEAADSTASPWALMVLASAITKRLDAAWAVGSGNGGLDTGTIADGTYHVWLIERSDTGVVDALFSTSASSPTMPANYDRKRRIGSIVRVSAAIRGFIQTGDEFVWKAAMVEDVDANNPGTSAVTRTLSVPLGISVLALVAAALTDLSSTGVTYFLLSSLSQSDGTPIYYNSHLRTQNAGGGAAAEPGLIYVRTNTSGQVRSRINVSTADHYINMSTVGWTDTRGRLE